jgi:hypothetical protein
MPKWTEYTTKDTLADNDEVMLYDATGRVNKRGLMSKFWDYVVDKMATAVISKLETENKTVIGALNYLNGNTFSGRTVKIEPKGTITVTYNRYTTASIFGFRKGMYLFSNGYITTIKQDDQVSVSISTDYKTITFKNKSSAEWAYGVLLLSDSNPTITSLK